MSFVVALRVSIDEIDINRSKDILVVHIVANQALSIFNPPFSLLPVELANFPVVSIIYIKLYDKDSCIAEGMYDIEGLSLSKRVESIIQLRSPEETNPEDFRPRENSNQVIVGSLKISVEIKENEEETCRLCPIIENFNTISERTLEIITEINKNVDVTYNGSINDLGMEIKEIDEYERLSPQKIKNIKCLLIGVNEKMKVLDCIKAKNNNYQISTTDDLKTRENMRNSFKKACIEYLAIKNKLDDINSQQAKKIKILNEKTIGFGSLKKEFEDYKTNSEIEKEILISKIKQLDNEKSADQKSENIIKELQFRLELSEKSQSLQKTEFSNLKEGYEKIIFDYQNSLNQLLQENSSFSQDSQNLKKEINILKTENEIYLRELNLLKSQQSEYQSKMLYIAELEKGVKTSEELANKNKENYENSKIQLESLSQRYHEGSKSLYHDKLLLSENNKKLTEEIIKIRQELLEAQTALLDVEKTGKTSAFDSKYTDLISQNIRLLQDSQNFCNLSNKFESEMMRNTNVYIKAMLENSERHLMLQRLLSKVLGFFGDKAKEIRILSELVAKLQKDMPIYIPVRGDFIDNTLANYLNSMTNKLDVPFVRLDNGIYLFGTKKVILRIENIGIVSN